MTRKKFLALLGGAAAAGLPAPGRAQQADRPRRIAVLIGTNHDAQTRSWVAGFQQGLDRLGWHDGRNVVVDYRFTEGVFERIAALARELVALQPDVILSQGTAITAAFRRETQTIPIVFLTVSDPIGSGYVASLSRPGGNLTGLLMHEGGIAGKWLGMLKEVAPQTARVALLASPATAYDYFVKAAIDAAPSVGVELVPFQARNADDIRSLLEGFARQPNGGLMLPPDNTTLSNRDLVVSLAAQHRLPAVYALRTFVVAGGLMSYGTDNVAMYRNAAFYIDRILKGTRPADLPVQAPTRYETIINQKTANALGLTVPSAMLIAADEVID